MTRHIEAAEYIYRHQSDFHDTLVDIAIRVLRQHKPEAVKLEVV